MSHQVTEHLPGLIGHELRNPLASAMTGAMLAREMVDAQDPRAAVLDGVLRDLDRMTGLIDGWLNLATDSAPDDEQTDLEALLQHASERLRAELIAAPPSIRVHGNATLLERAIDNLCENARNAGATKIRIAAQQHEDRVLVHVEDNGSGIDVEHAERIFEPGWSGGGGNGLGLYAIAATLQACDGEISCRPLAQGTRFTMTLSRAEGPSA